MKGLKKLTKEIKLKSKTKYKYRNNLKRLVKAMFRSLKIEVINNYKDYNNIELMKDLLNTLTIRYKDIFQEQSRYLVNDLIRDIEYDIRENNNSFFFIDFNSNNKEFINNVLEPIIENNVNLITNLADEVMFKVKESVYESITANDNTKSLYNRILNLENITSKRAKLIARDQTAKIFSDINIYNQQQSGIEYFLWQTANDERVSTGKGGHKQLHNKIYKYNDKSNYPIIDAKGTKGLPAQRVNCRCTAIPVVLEKGYKLTKQDDGSYRIVKEK